MNRPELEYCDRPPTDRQLEILRFIADGIREGLAPSRREIADRFNISSLNCVTDHLVALERKRLIERREVVARALRVTALGYEWLGETAPRCRSCGAEVAHVG